jgi:hypothetical protein
MKNELFSKKIELLSQIKSNQTYDCDYLRSWFRLGEGHRGPSPPALRNLDTPLTTINLLRV